MSAGVEVTFTGGRWHGQTREIPDGLDALILPSANGKMNETYRIDGDTATLESVTERVFPLKVGDPVTEHNIGRLPKRSAVLTYRGAVIQLHPSLGWLSPGRPSAWSLCEVVEADATILHIAEAKP